MLVLVLVLGLGLGLGQEHEERSERDVHHPAPPAAERSNPSEVSADFDLFATGEAVSAQSVELTPGDDEVLPDDLESAGGDYFADSFQVDEQSGAAAPRAATRLKVRLFGKDAGHTVEITTHRRAADFLNVSVITIDSARALTSGGYDWANKLVIQLTPEEMPEAIATLMGLIPVARFEHHGSDRSKFLEMRNEEGGMLMVTGHKSTTFAVPIKTPNLYYLLDLMCRAMAGTAPGRSVTEVTCLVRGIYA